MRISDRYERFTDRLGTSKAGAAKESDKASVAKQGASAAPAPALAGVLSVKVSEAATTLANGAQRLEQLRDQVRNGTFKVDARAIANALVGEDA